MNQEKKLKLLDEICEIAKQEERERILKIISSSALFASFVRELPRQIGHTTAALEGVRNIKEARLVVLNEAQKRNVDLPKNKLISIQEIKDYKLAGVRCPLVFDHYAVGEELSMIINKI